MPDAHTNPVNVVKKAALDAVEASNPVNVEFGTVISSSPLKISLDQKRTLGVKQLILSRNVTDFAAELSGGGVTVYNALKVGEMVILLRLKGGQRFLVLDRMGVQV